MKRLTTNPDDDSLGALMSICPNSTVDEQQGMYSREFQTMLEGLDGEEDVAEEESCHKKRRLSVDQVKALEKNFEVDNKLEPERKVKLAGELGLQPRQVAVWFQNRRARWKTKQLERDYGLLKANHDALKLTFEALQRDNDNLLNQIKELRGKLVGEEEITADGTVKEEEEEEEDDYGNNSQMLLVSFLKDGSSDSDSSAILNEEIGNNKKSGDDEQQMVDIHSHSGCFVKVEEHNFFGEESCSTLFSDEQAPTLSWCCSDHWN